MKNTFRLINVLILKYYTLFYLIILLFTYILCQLAFNPMFVIYAAEHENIPGSYDLPSGARFDPRYGIVHPINTHPISYKSERFPPIPLNNSGPGYCCSHCAPVKYANIPSVLPISTVIYLFKKPLL